VVGSLIPCGPRLHCVRSRETRWISVRSRRLTSPVVDFAELEPESATLLAIVGVAPAVLRRGIAKLHALELPDDVGNQLKSLRVAKAHHSHVR
jgi:hypothetical protein